MRADKQTDTLTSTTSTSARLFACPLAYLPNCISHKPHVQISPTFLYMLSVAVAWSSCDGSCNMLCTSGMWMTSGFQFSHNGANSPESDDAHVSSIRQFYYFPLGGEVCYPRLTCSSL